MVADLLKLLVKIVIAVLGLFSGEVNSIKKRPQPDACKDSMGSFLQFLKVSKNVSNPESHRGLEVATVNILSRHSEIYTLLARNRPHFVRLTAVSKTGAQARGIAALGIWPQFSEMERITLRFRVATTTTVTCLGHLIRIISVFCEIIHLFIIVCSHIIFYLNFDWSLHSTLLHRFSTEH